MLMSMKAGTQKLDTMRNRNTKAAGQNATMLAISMVSAHRMQGQQQEAQQMAESERQSKCPEDHSFNCSSLPAVSTSGQRFLHLYITAASSPITTVPLAGMAHLKV